MELAQILQILQAKGLLVNNLFQRDDGLWQANLRKAPGFFGFGTGDGMEAALMAALAQLDNGEVQGGRRQSPKPGPSHVISGSPEDLGL